MALETPKWLSDALRWRWTPALALVAGSLAYVLLATSLVPAEISFSPKTGSGATTSPGTGLMGAVESGVDTAAPITAEATAESPDGAVTSRSRRQRRRQALAEAAQQNASPEAPPPSPEGSPSPEPTP